MQDHIEYWDNYSWPQGGDEWSSPWGATEMVWAGTLLPRIFSFVPTGTILEIAPGFGRITHYLRNLCRQLLVVDFSERCIQACRQRFADCSHISYFVNDGQSLPMITDNSVDFVLSYDSLVHADAAIMQAYLHELAKKVKPQGVGFLHHSNLGHYVDPATKRPRIDSVHGRAYDMTAELFEQFAAEAGLQCITQELINWGGDALLDCFSLFTPNGSPLATTNFVVATRNFGAEVARLNALSRLYVPQRIRAADRLDGCYYEIPDDTRDACYRVIPDDTGERWRWF
jgi:SAM-dependent methyltransferase